MRQVVPEAVAEVVPAAGLPVEQPVFMYPHESPELLPGSSLRNAASLGQLGRMMAGRLLRDMAHMGLGMEELHAIGGRMIYEAYNGPVGAELQHKQRFVEAVTELGYLAPASVVVEPGDSSSPALEAIAALDPATAKRFCKPVLGCQGRGVFVAASPRAALNFVAGASESYLVQAVEEPEQDWRYILHRDTRQLEAGLSPAWRVVYGKVRPQVTGDGRLTIGQLVTAHPDMPRASQGYYKSQHRDQLDTIPADGEKVALIKSGNISQGAYARMPNSAEERNLDIFMSRFLAALEKREGGPLGTACFDIGVKDAGVLAGEYDEEAMRRNIVFYELQMPFGISGYLSLLPDQRDMWARTLPTIVYTRFCNSMLASGRLLRTLQTAA